MADEQKYRNLSDAHLDELSKDPRNLVYKYVDREPLPDSEIVPVDDVKDKITRLYSELTSFRQRFIDRGVPIQQRHWKRIVARINKNEEWARFSFTHPLIFDRIVHPETTEKEITALMFMMFLYARRDTVPNGKEVLAEYLMTNFSMTPAEWEQQKIKDGITN